MEKEYSKIKQLLQEKADLEARLKLLPYDGSPEIKNVDGKRYLYIRKRIGPRLTSTYVGPYSEELYALLLNTQRERRALGKSLRGIKKSLAEAGYSSPELSPRVMLNLEFARVNMKSNIYDQAVLEGVATTFPQTETILENGIVSGVSVKDIEKILNLKRAWEFILDEDVISYPSDFSILSGIAKLVNEGFYHDGGRLRSVPVTIGGSSYIPPIPLENDVKEGLKNILDSSLPAEEKAITLCLYCMKGQFFNDGNKRSSIIYANHYLISQGAGLLVVPEKEVGEFKRLLLDYYEDRNDSVASFMKQKCLRRF